MHPLVKALLKTLVNPPRILRKRIVCEDGFLVGYGELVYGVSSDGYVLSFFVGSLPDESGFKFFKKFANARDYSLLVYRNQTEVSK